MFTVDLTLEPGVRRQTAVVCHSAWGPNADRLANSLTCPRKQGSTLEADSHLSPAGAYCGQRACMHAGSSAGPSDTGSRRRQDRSRQRLWLVRADRAWTLRVDLVRSRCPRHMGQSCFRRGERLNLAVSILRRRIACLCETKPMTSCVARRSIRTDDRVRDSARDVASRRFICP